MQTREAGVRPAARRRRVPPVPAAIPPRPLRLDDPARLAALHATGLLRDPADGRLDHLSRLAARVSGSPRAAVTLLDSLGQTFAGLHGASPGFPRRVGLQLSICRDVVEGARTVRIADAASDPSKRVRAVHAGMGVGAYLGVPLSTQGGYVLGAFCLIDPEPRAWTPEDEATLGEFAGAAMAEIALRTERDARARAEADLLEKRTLLDVAMESSGHVGTWVWDVGAGLIRIDRHAARLFGLDAACGEIPVADFVAMIHPDDRMRVVARIALLGTGADYAEEHRIVRPDGGVVWIESRGRGVPGADGGRRFTGIVADITHLKHAAQRQADITAEMGHRMKNLMATVQAIVFQTLREAEDLGEAAVAVGERMAALGRSHDLLLSKGWGEAGVGETVGLVLNHFGKARFDALGPEVSLPPRAALALSMALHELATNAVKYGALSVTGGRVRVAWTVDGADGGRRIALSWSESGGPPVSAPTRRGLGTRLLDRVLSAEMHGRAAVEYDPRGLSFRIEGDLAAMRREHALAERGSA